MATLLTKVAFAPGDHADRFMRRSVMTAGRGNVANVKASRRAQGTKRYRSIPLYAFEVPF